jgi:1,4-dihydroxy-6-naphthoate synthase
MGDKYGPMVVAREPLTVDQLKTKRIAIPGTLTTAFLTLKLLLGDRFEFGVVPFDQILDKVEKGEYDAGLIIHEGQLTYASQGLKLVVDLGVWWQDRTGLPLPLGGNVVRRDLGDELLIKISKLLRQSIRHGLQHRREAMEYALKYGRDLNMDLADRFVGMYVNDWTIDYGERGRAAVRLLLGEGAEKGYVPALPSVDFVDDGE